MSLLQETARKTAGLLGRESWLVRRLRPAYESLLGRSHDGRGIPWTINGVSYRIDPHYRHRMGSEYDSPVAEFLRQRIRPGALCVDVGANVGVYVLQFANWSGPNGKVVAFEPNPAARDALERHVQMNELSERVTIVPAAVGANAGEAVLYAADVAGMSRLGEANKAIADRVSEITVPVVTLDEYCKTEGLRPDWLFIDIEGFEIAALSGARQLVKSRGRDMNIVVEIHPDVWSSAETTRAQAEALLGELKLRAVSLMGQSDPLAEHGLVYLEHV
ncbi:MAG: FkbM family methyltransferase [Pyrinomonadaceae bacterium]|nr:FkbM family methyltransferase [Pyrinomonadaceae bacterium]